MKIRWRPSATLALLNMPPPVAVQIDRAVQQWAATGEGIVHSAEGGVFLLYLDVHVVEFFIDAQEDTMHVDRVRRA
ncbi:MAG TPA: hypothetical protein VGY54_02635 [Polyangiaceae bacterium]|jgi:hypothetical protein|nr:hypothetical protein [Polyangiaceae bacterium]